MIRCPKLLLEPCLLTFSCQDFASSTCRPRFGFLFLFCFGLFVWVFFVGGGGGVCCFCLFVCFVLFVGFFFCANPLPLPVTSVRIINPMIEDTLRMKYFGLPVYVTWLIRRNVNDRESSLSTLLTVSVLLYHPGRRGEKEFSVCGKFEGLGGWDVVGLRCFFHTLDPGLPWSSPCLVP